MMMWWCSLEFSTGFTHSHFHPSFDCFTHRSATRYGLGAKQGYALESGTVYLLVLTSWPASHFLLPLSALYYCHVAVLTAA